MGESIKETVGAINERTVMILERLEKGDKRMDNIENHLYSLPCKTQLEKVKNLERITWASVFGIAGMLATAVWEFFIKGSVVKP